LGAGPPRIAMTHDLKMIGTGSLVAYDFGIVKTRLNFNKKLN